MNLSYRDDVELSWVEGLREEEKLDVFNVDEMLTVLQKILKILNVNWILVCIL